MGTVADQVCCITPDDIIKKETINDTASNINMSRRSFCVSNSISLPISEMKMYHPYNSVRIKSLSNLPISNQTVIRKQSGNPLSSYEVLGSIGKGTYGNVYKVRHKVTGIIRTMKMIPKDNLTFGFTEEEINREITILKKLDHPKIIKLYEFYNDDDNYYLINEYCSEGDLREKLNQINSFPECIAKVLMFQIFSAVAYLHSRGVIHGDLKLENILIDSSLPENANTSFISSIKEDAKDIDQFFQRSYSTTGSSSSREKKKYKYSKMKNFDLKIIDFGCSKIFNKYKKNFDDTIGTLLYCSPEVLKNNYNEKCDIWSCGIVMYALLTGEFPFIGSTEREITKKILSNKLYFDSPMFKNVSSNAKDLIRKCLTYDKNKRISITKALNHPFFTDDIDPTNIFQENLDSKDILLSLKNFSKHSKFYQAVLAFLSHNFAEKDYLDRLKKVFCSIDLNLDGKISREELLTAYDSANIQLKDNQIDKIIESIDLDNNGFIEYGEFISATIPKKHLFKEENLKSAFCLFDTEKRGYISIKGIIDVLGLDKNTDESVIQELIGDIKQDDNDDMITFDKFKKIITSVENDLTSSCTL